MRNVLNIKNNNRSLKIIFRDMIKVQIYRIYNELVYKYKYIELI